MFYSLYANDVIKKEKHFHKVLKFYQVLYDLIEEGDQLITSSHLLKHINIVFCHNYFRLFISRYYFLYQDDMKLNHGFEKFFLIYLYLSSNRIIFHSFL